MAALCWSASAAWPDTPLRPPADFTHDQPHAIVHGKVQNQTTWITPKDDAGAIWSIPVWARFYQLSPDARSILVLNPGGNLIGSRAPHQTVMTVWYPENGRVTAKHFSLSEVMDPADMPQTVSHYSWLEGYEAGADGWRLSLSDGRTITVTYR